MYKSLYFLFEIYSLRMATMKLSEKREPRRIFGPLRDEVTGE